MSALVRNRERWVEKVAKMVPVAAPPDLIMSASPDTIEALSRDRAAMPEKQERMRHRCRVRAA